MEEHTRRVRIRSLPPVLGVTYPGSMVAALYMKPRPHTPAPKTHAHANALDAVMGTCNPSGPKKTTKDASSSSSRPNEGAEAAWRMMWHMWPWPMTAAQWRGVHRSRSRPRTSAPRKMSKRVTSPWPLYADQWSGDLPSSSKGPHTSTP